MDERGTTGSNQPTVHVVFRPSSVVCSKELSWLISHISTSPAARRMVDVSAKDDTVRVATARRSRADGPATLGLVRDGGMAKGDVLGIAQVAG